MPDEPIIRDNQDRTPSVLGTRLTIYNIMDDYLAGRSAALIAGFYDIPRGDAQAAVDYIHAHLGELMPTYQRDLERKRRGNPPHIEAMFAESDARLPSSPTTRSPLCRSSPPASRSSCSRTNAIWNARRFGLWK